MDIKEIFEKWIEFTEVNPDKKRFVMTDKNINVFGYNEYIKKAMENGDPFDAVLVLKDCFNEYIQTIYYSVYNILNKTEEYMKKIGQAEELVRLLNSNEVTDYEKYFFKEIDNVSEFYGIKDRISDMSRKKILDITVKAKHAANSLETLRFKKGVVSDKKPVFSKIIRGFHDINEMLAITAAEGVNGISLNFISDKDNEAYSYFCFVIKNGNNIWMMSDRPKENISRKFNGRSSGRLMQDRIDMFLYPYEVIEVVKKNTLPGKDGNSPIICTFDSCNSDSLLWICMVISLLHEKFFCGNETPECKDVYSGGMVYLGEKETAQETEIIPAGKYGLSLSENFNILNMGKISYEDVRNNEITYSKTHKPHHFNDWLIEKYGGQVKEEYLNLSGENGIDTIKCGDDDINVMKFDRNIVGTEEEIRNTRLFIARNNMAQMLEYLYHEDVKKQMHSLETWYRNKLEERKDWLRKVLKDGKLILPKRQYTRLTEDGMKKYRNGEKIGYDSEITFSVAFDLIRDENCLTIDSDIKDIIRINCTDLAYIDNKRKRKSWWNKKEAFYVYKINVNCPEAIAELLGMETGSLPEMLQHYTPMKNVGEGNSILCNLDPVEHIRNWISMFPADVYIFVSKSDIANAKK